MKYINKVLSYLGFNPRHAIANFRGFFWFLADVSKFKKESLSQGTDRIFKLKYHPVLTDKADFSGASRGQYFYQDLYVANRIFEDNPIRHIDIGSRVDGFVAHVASFRPIEVFDIRPGGSSPKNITFVQADLMNVGSNMQGITESLSCLHTIEHFGLGRYGDPIDVNGHLKGLDNMGKMLAPGGRFYFSTQIGPMTVEFNAGRIFSLKYLLDYFSRDYIVELFAYIDDSDHFFEDVRLDPHLIETNGGCRKVCGIFLLKKRLD
jgi:SAM-dependent methyltransferase